MLRCRKPSVKGTFSDPFFSLTRTNDLFTRVAPELLDPKAPVMTAAELDKVLDPTDEEARAVLGRINVRKQNQAMYYPMMSFTNESYFGYKALLERGGLTLVAS